MAHFKPLVFGIKCDICGKILYFKKSYCFDSEKQATLAAIKAGWSCIDDRHICPQCTTFETKSKELVSYQVYDKNIIK